MASTSSTPRWRHPRPAREAGLAPDGVLAAKRARLGTALHELAKELARERRRYAQLERENRRLRDLLVRHGGAER